MTVTVQKAFSLFMFISVYTSELLSLLEEKLRRFVNKDNIEAAINVSAMVT